MFNGVPENVVNSRSGLAADFAATNPWLGDGEERTETDTGKSKTGPGYWNDLSYGAGQDGGGSGASVQPANATALWTRVGAVDGTTNSFNFTTDLQVPDPYGFIVVDNSDEWVNTTVGYGYGVPMVTEAGLYVVSVQVQGSPPSQADDTVAASVGIAVMDGSGSDLIGTPWGEGMISTFPSTVQPAAVLTATLPLPANAHIDPNGVGVFGTAAGAAAAVTSLNLFIKRLL